MYGSLKTVVTVTAVIAALAAGPVLHAQPESAGPQGPGSMMKAGQGDMMGMMKMMQQMSGMMDACTKMMQGTAQPPAPETPKEGAPAQKNG